MINNLNTEQSRCGINSASDFFGHISKKYRRYVGVFLSTAQIATKTKAVASHLFSETSLRSLSQATYFQDVNWLLEQIFTGSSSLAVKVRDVMAFVSIRTLKRKLIKHIENARLNFSEGNADFFTTSIIKILSTVGAIFDAPRVTRSFLKVFGIIVPSKWLDKLFIPNLVSLTLAPTKIITKIRACMSTKSLLNELTQKKYKAFLKAYGKESKSLKGLSTAELRAKAHKKKLKQKEDSDRFKELQHAANKSFAKALNKKIQENSRILDKIFKVYFENKGGINFFEALMTEEMQDISNAENLKMAVKAVKSRLQHRIYTNYFAIFAKAVSFGSGVIGQLETFSIPLNPISPVKNAIEGVLAVLLIANSFYQGKKKEEFVSAMENATGHIVKHGIN